MKKAIISIVTIFAMGMGIALCSCGKNSGTKVSDVTVIDDNNDFLYCAENRDGTVSIGFSFGKTAIVNKKGITTGYKYNSGSIKVASEIKGLPVRDVELTVISGLIESEAVTVPLIELPEGVKKLKLDDSDDYVNITEVKIPDSVTSLYVSSNNVIKKIKLPAGVEYYCDTPSYVEHGEEKNGYVFGVEEITVPANVKVFALPYDDAGRTKNIEFLGSDTKFYTDEGTRLTAAIGKVIEGREITKKEIRKIFKNMYGYN